MGIKRKLVIISFLILLLVALSGWYLVNHNIAVLSPAGIISSKERSLIFLSLVLSAIVVIPVYGLTIYIALKYRETNKSPKKYTPEWDGSRLYESIWWAVPLLIITILSIVTWQSSHALDPYKPIDSNNKPINIQVIALDWKWLFIYPNEGIASVNILKIPINTPIDFNITSDSVMNSFWIPKLGSQIYAMPGMTSQVHLEASQLGRFYGSSANISGQGFSGMNFTAISVINSDYRSWVNQVKKGSQILDLSSYSKLARPSQNQKVLYYSTVDNGLFDYTAMKYMTPLTSEVN